MTWTVHGGCLSGLSLLSELRGIEEGCTIGVQSIGNGVHLEAAITDKIPDHIDYHIFTDRTGRTWIMELAVFAVHPKQCIELFSAALEHRHEHQDH